MECNKHCGGCDKPGNVYEWRHFNHDQGSFGAWMEIATFSDFAAKAEAYRNNVSVEFRVINKGA